MLGKPGLITFIKTKVMEVICQSSLRPMYDRYRVDQPLPMNLVWAEEAKDPDGINSTMPDPSISEEVLIAHAIRDRLGAHISGHREHLIA